MFVKSIFFKISKIYLLWFSAAKFATERVNNDHTILNDYELKITILNGKCQTVDVLATFTKYITFNSDPHSKMIGILGNTIIFNYK